MTTLRVRLSRISQPTISSIAKALGATRYILDWGGGLIWAALPARPQLKTGHATLMRAPEKLRRDEKNFTVDGPATLMAEVKQAFDPKRIFNRGRMVEGL